MDSSQKIPNSKIPDSKIPNSKIPDSEFSTSSISSVSTVSTISSISLSSDTLQKIIQYRCCNQLLKHKIEYALDLLKFIQKINLKSSYDSKDSIDLIIAYDEICKVLQIKDQYIDEKHFLVDSHHNYFVYKAFIEKQLDIPNTKKPRSLYLSQKLKISKWLYECLRNGISNGKFNDVSDEIKFYNNCIEMPNLYLEPKNNFAISTDAFEQFNQISWNKINVNEVIERCKLLQSEIPEYWDLISAQYQTELKRLYILNHITGSQVLDLMSIYPNLTDFDISKFSEIAQDILCQPLLHQYYLLGFNLLNEVPNQQKSLMRLSKFNIDNYYKTLEQRNLKFIQSQLIQDEVIVNEENILQEKWINFNISDLALFIEGGHAYIFTRNEFDYILKNKRNQYTNLQFPDFFIEKVRLISEMAERYRLPSAKPLIDVVKKLNS